LLLADLAAALRVDLGDPEGLLLDATAIDRALRRALFQVGRDLTASFAVVAGEVVPEPSSDAADLISLFALISACQMMRAKSANAFSFSSGDKRVDKTSQPEHWAKLEADLLALYRRRLGEITGGSDVGDDSILRPSGLSALVFERGVDVDPAVGE
jgi:hypothetical protein